MLFLALLPVGDLVIGAVVGQAKVLTCDKSREVVVTTVGKYYGESTFLGKVSSVTPTHVTLNLSAALPSAVDGERACDRLKILVTKIRTIRPAN